MMISDINIILDFKQASQELPSYHHFWPVEPPFFLRLPYGNPPQKTLLSQAVPRAERRSLRGARAADDRGPDRRATWWQRW